MFKLKSFQPENLHNIQMRQPLIVEGSFALVLVKLMPKKYGSFNLQQDICRKIWFKCLKTLLKTVLVKT